jgi:hypothetical protein
MTLTRDTTATARRVQLEALRRLDGATRLLMACEMSDDSRQVTLSGIRHRHPDWTDAAVHRELLRIMLGRDLATAVLERRRPHR